MEKILDIITAKMQKAFAEAGYEASFGRVTVSNRPDLCEYQCNGALAAAKQYKCAPIAIANAVAEKLEKALAICNEKMNMTGRPGGNTCAEFAAAVMAEVEAM